MLIFSYKTKYVLVCMVQWKKTIDIYDIDLHLLYLYHIREYLTTVNYDMIIIIKQINN